MIWTSGLVLWLSYLYSIALASNLTGNTPVVVTTNKSFTTADPTWVTSPFFRAGDEAVISTLTGSSQTPTYTFTYSSALPGVPNLAYGIKTYRGNDYLGQEYFEIRKVALDASSFTVSIQIYGVTNIHILAVAYLAIDPTFPHHLNSFDNVPLNYSSGALVNISSKSNTQQYFTEVINYTQQSTGRTFNTFTTPLTSNYIVLYMTSFWVQATFASGSTSYPVQFHINTQVLNASHYMWNATVRVQVAVTNVHFSQVIFNSDDVQSSNKYFIVYNTWTNDIDGGFIDIPYQFVDNFIMGVTSFQTVDGRCGYEYQWEFANGTVGNQTTFGVELYRSWTLKNTCGFSWSKSSIFYMRTWQCPENFTFFNLSSNLCQDFCGGYYYQNTTSNNCDPCQNNNCYQCNDTSNRSICTLCLADDLFELVNNDSCVCFRGYAEVNETCTLCSEINTGCLLCDYGELPSEALNIGLFNCTSCNETADYFLNGTILCQVCSLSNCLDCVNLTVCQQCQPGYNFSSAYTCIICNVTGCLFCSPNDSMVCDICDNANGYYLNGSICEGICGDGIVIVLNEGCDDNNTDTLDGCDDSCQVETHFNCSMEPSLCHYTTNATLVLVEAQMHPTECNVLSLTFAAEPNSDVFTRNDISWDGFVTTPNVSMLILNSSLTNSTNNSLTLHYYLNATVENETLTFEANHSVLLPHTSIFDVTDSPPLVTLIVTNGSNKTAVMECCVGFELNSSTYRCTQICGDGILFDWQCDDGDLVDGDGCSSNCTIEWPYVCVNGTNQTASVCSYNDTISLTHNAATKRSDSNTLDMTYTLSPTAPFLLLLNSSTNLTEYLFFPSHPEVTVTSAELNQTTGQIQLVAQYSVDLQDQMLTIQLLPPDVPEAFSIPNITNDWYVSTDNFLSVAYYTEDDYAAMEQVETVAKCTMWGYLAVVLFACFFRKFLGLELATLLQIGWLSLVWQDQLGGWLIGIRNWGYVFGYNDYLPTPIASALTSSQYSYHHYSDHFGYAFNAMLLIMASIYLLGLAAVIWAYLLPDEHSCQSIVRAVYILILLEIGFAIMVLSFPNVVVALGWEVKSGVITDFSILWSKFFLIFTLMLVPVGLIYAFKSLQQSFDYGTYWRKDSKTGLYAPIYFVGRLTLLTILLFMDQDFTPSTTYLCIIVQVVYLLFVIFGRPHMLVFDFIRAIIIESSLFTVLSFRFLEVQILPNFVEASSFSYEMLGILQVSIYALAIVITVIAFIIHVVRALNTTVSDPIVHLVESRLGDSDQLSNNSNDKISEQLSASKRTLQPKQSMIINVEEIETGFDPDKTDYKVDWSKYKNRRKSKFRRGKR